MYNKEHNYIIIEILLAVAAVVWSVATLRYGFYIDENGLLTIYKGIYQGQRMFVDSWEALQTGGLLAWPLMALYYQVLKPLFLAFSINVGLVLYMRYAYLLVRLIISIYLYATLKSSKFERGAFFASLFYFMFVIGWKDFSYKSYCDFAMVLIMCFVFRFHENRKPVYACLTGVAVCVAVLAYPTMIVMALFLGAYWLYMFLKDEAPRSAFISYLLVCLIVGGAVAIYLQFTSGWPDIMTQIVNLGDQDYDDPVYIRLGKMLLSYLAFFVIAYMPIVAVRLWDRIRGVSEEAERTVLTLYFIIFMVAMFVIKTEGISTSRFIYGCLIVFFWFPYFVREKEKTDYIRIGSYRNIDTDDKQLLWTVFIFSVVAQLIWAISTNQEITVPGHMALYVVMIMILIFCQERYDYRGMVAVLMLLAAFFMGIWVADSNGGFCHVFEKMYYVTEGELKGIALPEDEYELNQQSMELLNEYVTADDTLLVTFGANCAGYLNSDATQGTYSVYARTQLNTKIIDYYTLNPENMADYMLLDTGHAKYETFLENETSDYLLNIYTNTVGENGEFILLSR